MHSSMIKYDIETNHSKQIIIKVTNQIEAFDNN